MDCVVDASVGIKLLVEEELSRKAEALFAFLAGERPPAMYVPELFRIECANILWKHVRRHSCELQRAIVVLRALGELELLWVPLSELTVRALPLAVRHDITVYDATYVALSQMVGLPLVTADERLIRKLGHCHDVISLADI